MEMATVDRRKKCTGKLKFILLYTINKQILFQGMYVPISWINPIYQALFTAPGGGGRTLSLLYLLLFCASK